MNTIKIFLAESGRIADLKKDFPLYQGQYQNKLLNVFVPTSILAPNFSVQESGNTIADYVSSTAVKIGMRTIERNGKINTSKTYYMRYLKTLTYQNVEYALYERKLPREFTFYAGQGENAPVLIANVVNINNETTPATILDITTSQSCSLDVMPSGYLDTDEPIEATALEEINSRLNAIDKDLAKKQNIQDDTLETTAKTIVGAINENKSRIDSNTQDISENTQNISQNRNDIDVLKQTIGTGEDYIGRMVVNALPNNNELSSFVQQQKGRDPKGGDCVIVVLQIDGETDKNYKYIYNGTSWSYYEIPPIEEASNDTLGLIEGTYGIGLDYGVLVDISGGQIRNIYVKANDNQYKNLQTYINMNAQDIIDIITGDTVVGEAMRAVEDGVGNNIVNTYLTKVLGATKQYVRDYAQPREFSNIYFISTNGYVLQVPETPPSGIQFSVNTNAVGSFRLFQIEKQNTAKFELSSMNGYSNNLYVSASSNCVVAFRLTTQYKKTGSDWQNLNVELSNNIELLSGDIQRISLNSPFISLGDNVLTLNVGDSIRQTLEVVTQTSENITFNLYSNDTYPSTFTLTSQSYTLADIDQIKSQIIFMGVDGVVEANRVVFEVQNPNSFIEYRTNQREFLITALLPLVGQVNPTLPVAITFGDKTYNVYSFMKGATSPLTIGDLMSVSKYSAETGYLFFSKMIFVETSDITGFVLTPANITASQLAEIIDTNGNLVVSLDNTGTKLSFYLSDDTVSKLSRALLTPLNAPEKLELVAVDNTNSQEMLSLGDRFKVETNELGLSSETELTLDFAESERQKSKNLLEVNNGLNATNLGLHVQINNDVITVDGTLTHAAAINVTTFNPKIYAGKTYTLSFKDYSNLSNFEITTTGTRNDGTQRYNMLNLTSLITSTTITADVDYELKIEVYSTTTDGTISGTFKLQLEEGSVATDYQPYNGAIVHEKEIADVEHIEVLYDKTSSDANINKGLTSGIPFDNTTELNLGANLSSKYKGTYVYITIWNIQLRIYCDITYGQERYSFLGYDINSGVQTLVMGCVSIAKSTGILKGTKLVSGNIGGSTYSTLTDGKYNIYKVEGVK